MEAISLIESKRLIALEAQIEKGKEAWKSAGRALIEIRDSHLYRAEFETFWDYCAAKWGWKKRNVNTLIESYEVWKQLPAGGQNFAHSANHVQALKSVAPEKRAEVIEAAASVAASESRPMTARDIKEAAAPDPEPPAPPDPEPPRAKDAELVAALGGVNVRQFHARRIEELVDEIIMTASEDQLHAAKLALETGAKKIGRAMRTKGARA